MTNWKNIHSDFTTELQQQWESKGFNHEKVKKWIDIGLKPTEYSLADFIEKNLGFNPESIPNTIDNSNIETFRKVYAKNLEQSQQGQFDVDDFQIQEAITQSLLNLDLNQKREVDQGWLTDDNIEYILKNDEIIRVSQKVQIKTDIANIYFQMDKAKRGETIDEDFWNSLNTKKKYVILPLRVSGNHWSLLLLINSENTGKVNWLYYISSLGEQAIEEEITEISRFLKQFSKKFGTADNTIINENNLSEMVFKENPRQPNTWDCGVYLCKFIQFLCVDEYYNLNEANYRITESEVKEFRTKWKNKIGAEKWCKWDANIANVSVNNEESELQKAITLSLQEKGQNNRSVVEEQQLNEALTKSLLVSKEDNYLQEILLSSSQNTSQTEESQKIIEELIQENNNLKTEIKKLKAKNDTLSNQAFMQQIEVDNLKHKKVGLEEEIYTEELNLIKQELEREKTKNQELVKRLEELEKNKNQSELQTKKAKLRRLVEKIRTAKMSENLGDDLEDFLEAQEEVIRNNNSYVQKQLKKYKAKLLEKLAEEELEEISQLKTEIVELEVQLGTLAEQLETRILVPERSNRY